MYETYSHVDDDGIKYRFPDTSKVCNFTEAKYPLKPWPQGCKIYQAGDYCNTYEISDTGRWIQSCDIAMKASTCIATE